MKKILILVLSGLLLSACEKENDFSYLIRHPVLLRQEVMRCQASIDKSPYCTHILSIAERFDEITNQEIQGAQELGAYVLQAQSACVAAKLELKNSEDALRELNAKKATPAQISAAEKKVAANREVYEAKHEEVQILYSVLGRNSPE